MNASGAKLVFDNFEKKLKGSIFDFILYLVQILIWYVSPLLIFFLNFLKILVYEFLFIFILKVLFLCLSLFSYFKLLLKLIFFSGL